MTRELIVVNPNTNAATTAMMADIARAALPPGWRVATLTAAFGEPLIVAPEALDVAARAVLALAPSIAAAAPAGIVVAAFGDPGLAALRAALDAPVTGIAEAGMAEAARYGRFAVVTTTPLLVPRIARSAAEYGHARVYAGTRLTPGDPAALTADPARLLAALRDACRTAIAEDRVDAIVIGGGPLAVAARALAAEMPVPLVEPVPAAVRLAVARAA